MRHQYDAEWAIEGRVKCIVSTILYLCITASKLFRRSAWAWWKTPLKKKNVRRKYWYYLAICRDHSHTSSLYLFCIVVYCTLQYLRDHNPICDRKNINIRINRISSCSTIFVHVTIHSANSVSSTNERNLVFVKIEAREMSWWEQHRVFRSSSSAPRGKIFRGYSET